MVVVGGAPLDQIPKQLGRLLLQCRFFERDGLVGVRDLLYQLIQLSEEFLNLEQARRHAREPA